MHWKASARSGELWVREYARQERREVRLVLDRREPEGPQRERLFEERVALCAAVLWKLSESGGKVTLLSDQIDLSSEAGGAPLDELLRYLAVVEAAPQLGPAPPAVEDDGVPTHRFSAALGPSDPARTLESPQPIPHAVRGHSG